MANPWFKRTITNTKLLNNWLVQQGITDPIYPDIADAAEALIGLLDVDEAARAQFLDGNGPKTFKGSLTGRTFDSIDTMIAQERQAAIEQQASVQQTDLERAFDKLPIEEQKQMLRNALSDHQTKADAKISEQNADSWITLHPEFRDDQYNGRLLLSQLKANGVTGVVTIEDYEIAERQLAASGLLRQNPASLRKQEAAEVIARAQRAVNTPGTIFDKTTEEEAYNLPMEELRRRANGNYSGS